MSLTVLLYFVAGLVLMLAGAEALVRGASRLAAALGISPLVIGLTVVAYGTSSPELAVSVQSTFSGQQDLALGNVVGSNIFNVLFILGLAATITPLLVAQQLIRLDVPLMILASLVLLLLGLDGKIGRFDGLLLSAGLIAYTVFLIHQSRKEKQAVKDEYARAYGFSPPATGARHTLHVILILGGLVLLVWGSRWMVQGAVAMAQALGISELIIGLTIIAAGTSLPEVATSVIASIRGEREIAVGNVVGSNIFNLLAVLGIAGLVAPQGIHVSTAALRFDLPVMIAVAVACLPIFFTGNIIARWEGVLFLAYYAAYTAYLILYSVQHDHLDVFSTVMMEFVLPLTAVTLITVAVRSARRQRRGA